MSTRVRHHSPATLGSQTQGSIRLALARFPTSLLPMLTLVLVTLIAAVLANATRPPVAVDVGDYYDRLYLSGFHDRETAPVLPQQRFEWPAGATELTVPYTNPDLRLGILRLDPTLRESDWGGALVFANGRRIGTLRESDNREEYLLYLPETSGSLRLELRPEAEAADQTVAVRIESLTLSAAQTYRWSRQEGIVRLPSLGRGAWLVSLGATTTHPDSSTVAAQLLVNNTQLATLPDSAERRRYTLMVPAELMSSGDFELRIQAQTFSDPRPLGALIEQVRLIPVGSTPLRPAWGLLLALLTLALAAYTSLARLRLPPWWAAAVSILIIGGATWGIIAFHGLMGFYLPRLALLALGSIALLLALRSLSNKLFALAGVPLQPWLSDTLLLLFLLSFWVKAGAMLWPYFVGIDVSWHMERIGWVLNGRLAEMYRPGGFSESVMPASEWGDNKPLIPYSPFFHIFGTVFMLSPLPLVMTANLISALVDTSRVFLVALLARKTGLSSREALICAALIAITPVTFLLHSWGNLPTTFGLWWAFASTTFIVAAYDTLHRRWPFIILTLMLTVTFLIYTVSGVFMGVFLAILAGILLLFGGRAQRRPALLVVWATLAACGLALLIYYGQYIPPMIERTLPYFSQTISKGQDAVGLKQETFGEYLSKFPNRLDYSGRPLYHGLLIPLLFYLLALTVFRQLLSRAVLVSALLLTLIFTIVGLRVPMVDKQIYYLIPFAALAGGAVFGRLWRYGRAGRLTTIVFYLFTLVAAIDLWIYRVANVQQ